MVSSVDFALMQGLSFLKRNYFQDTIECGIVDKLQNYNAFFRLAVLFILSQALRLFYF